MQPPTTPQQKPLYILQQKQSRAVIPKILSFLILGIIFYVGILLNLALLSLTASEETIVKISSLGLLLVVIIIGVILTFKRAHKPFIFYQSHIQFGKKSITYLNVMNSKPEKHFLDKIFKTYSINLGNHFHLRHIPQEIDIATYLNQLINYAKQRSF